MLKRDLYERLGVPAYWIVDPADTLLLALRLVGGGYTVESESGVTFRTDWPFPLEVTLADLTR
jgi:Uma2 family endonuclease